DVVRHAAVALAARGWTVDVVIPSYGFLHREPGANRVGATSVRFRGELTEVEVYLVPGRHDFSGVSHFVIDHPAFMSVVNGRPEIYRSDPPGRPFASDADKFALFAAAVVACVSAGQIRTPGVLHLHDWHAAIVILLRDYTEGAEWLRDVRVVFTIHNLAFQGIRPL